MLLLAGALLPGILWVGDPAAVEPLRNSGADRIYVPAKVEAEWGKKGMAALPATALTKFEKVPPPKIEMHVDVASATSVPWVEANGWRFLRGVRQALYAEVPVGRAALAAAEGFAYGVDAVVEPQPEDLPALASMLAFLRKIDAPGLPVRANIAVIDDGSDEIEEVLNLLSRRNLLYKVVREPEPGLLNVRLGTADFPRDSAADANEFAARIREKVTDERRLVRTYGSYTVIAHLTGDAKRARLHLLNYAYRPVTDLRVRVLGQYGKISLAENSNPSQQAADVAMLDGGTEFTVPVLGIYAVVDLESNQ